MSGDKRERDTLPIRVSGAKELGADKMARNTARFESDAPRLRKPSWIRVRLPSGNAVATLKSRLRERQLVVVPGDALVHGRRSELCPPHARVRDVEVRGAGAAAIGIGTALFYDPLVCSKINAGISDYLIANDMPSVADLVGTLSLPSE